jgi:hypothetical protein
MKKYLCLLALVVFSGMQLKAAPGDTTWVYAHDVQLPGYGAYDSTVTFPSPGTTYRKIFMIFTLGKYVCPGSPTYCGDWDYTVQNYLMTPGGDTLELGRLITPYANAGAPRTPWAWKQHYVFDVTEYAGKLQNSATMRLFYSGYTGGFTANIKFAFIEGTPDRNVIALKKLWNGSYGYGDTTHLDSFNINTHFTDIAEAAPAGTLTADMKFTVTGHGSDPLHGCCEFYPNSYQVMLNGIAIATKDIWRNDCTMNELYPQSGTWPINRGNWCPGSLVYSNFHDLTGVTAGSSFNIGVKFPPYYSGGGSYTTFGTLIYYGGMNKTLDASLDDIIAPNKDENHFRENPIVGSPTVHVKNSGATTITSITFSYGLKDSTMLTATWTGSLASREEADVVLSQLFQLNEISGVAGTYNFVASITAVNGVADDDSTNNKLTSQFIAAPRWPASFKISMTTNNESLPGNPTKSETSWAIYDRSDNVVAQRSDALISRQYLDTVTLPAGLYRLQIYDSGCDGLYWWYHAAAGDGVTAGNLSVRQLTGPSITMNGYNYGGQFNNDFGCGFTQYFYTGAPIDFTGITNVNEGAKASIDIFPNPAQGTVNVAISGMQQVNGKIQIFDALGRIAAQMQCNGPSLQIGLDNLTNGVYTIVFSDNASGNKLQQKLLIIK